MCLNILLSHRNVQSHLPIMSLAWVLLPHGFGFSFVRLVSKRLAFIVNLFLTLTELTRVRRNSFLVIQRCSLLQLLTYFFPFKIFLFHKSAKWKKYLKSIPINPDSIIKRCSKRWHNPVPWRTLETSPGYQIY